MGERMSERLANSPADALICRRLRWARSCLNIKPKSVEKTGFFIKLVKYVTRLRSLNELL